MSHGNCFHDFLESNLRGGILIHTSGSLNLTFYFQYERFIEIISFCSVAYLTPQSWATKWNYFNVKVFLKRSRLYVWVTATVETQHQTSHISQKTKQLYSHNQTNNHRCCKCHRIFCKGKFFLFLNTGMPICSQENMQMNTLTGYFLINRKLETGMHITIKITVQIHCAIKVTVQMH